MTRNRTFPILLLLAFCTVTSISGICCGDLNSAIASGEFTAALDEARSDVARLSGAIPDEHWKRVDAEEIVEVLKLASELDDANRKTFQSIWGWLNGQPEKKPITATMASSFLDSHFASAVSFRAAVYERVSFTYFRRGQYVSCKNATAPARDLYKARGIAHPGLGRK